MGIHTLSRWQKASALVPMAVLVGAWGIAATNAGLRATSSGDYDPGVPEVPATAFEQPATVRADRPAGIDQHAGVSGTLSTLTAAGIPAASLLAYRRAETLLARADSSCRLPWTLLAAIGRVESNHGRSGGNTVRADGVSSPGVYGIALTGTDDTARVTDSDGGSLDRDAVYDRAVGPMQFLPGTWKSAAVDADGDNAKNPQDIDDAAATAGVYLCAGSDDLSTPAGASAAVLRYNHSSSYVDLVLKIADAYAHGEFSESPNGSPSATVLTSRSHDQTLSAPQRAQARKDEARASRKDGAPTPPAKDDDSSAGAGTPATGTPTTTPTPTPTPKPKPTPPAGDGGTSTPTAPSTPGKTLPGTVGGTLDGTPLDPDTKPVIELPKTVAELLSVAEARMKCLLEPRPLNLDFSTCVHDLTHLQ